MNQEITISGGGLKDALTIKFAIGQGAKIPKEVSKKPIPKPKKEPDLMESMSQMIKNSFSAPKDKNGIPYVKNMTEPYH